MTIITQTRVNVFNAFFLTWMGLITGGQIPDNKWTHGISTACVAIAAMLAHLGWNRTPSGAVLPDVVTKMVDANKAQAVEGATTTTTVVEGASMQSSEPPKKP